MNGSDQTPLGTKDLTVGRRRTVEYFIANAPTGIMREIAWVASRRRLTLTNMATRLGLKQTAAVSRRLDEANPHDGLVAQWCGTFCILPEHWYLVEERKRSKRYIERQLLGRQWPQHAARYLQDISDELSEWNGFSPQAQSATLAVLRSLSDRRKLQLIGEYALTKYRSRFDPSGLVKVVNPAGVGTWWLAHPAMYKLASALQTRMDLQRERQQLPEQGHYNQVFLGLANIGVSLTSQHKVRQIILQDLQARGEGEKFQILNDHFSNSLRALCTMITRVAGETTLKWSGSTLQDTRLDALQQKKTTSFS